MLEGLTKGAKIASDYMGHKHEILNHTLHWTISKAIHAAFATTNVVKRSDLGDLRERFEADLKVTLKSRYGMRLTAKASVIT